MGQITPVEWSQIGTHLLHLQGGLVVIIASYVSQLNQSQLQNNKNENKYITPFL